MARIQSYHFSESDNQKLQSIGFHVGQTVPESEVTDVASKIFAQTTLNVMLQHNGAENSIIWVDERNFKQR